MQFSKVQNIRKENCLYALELKINLTSSWKHLDCKSHHKRESFIN